MIINNNYYYLLPTIYLQALANYGDYREFVNRYLDTDLLMYCLHFTIGI